MAIEWIDDLHWYYQHADGDLGVRGVGFDSSGVKVAPHERSSPAKDGPNSPAARHLQITQILAGLARVHARVIQRYYSWEPNRARLSIGQRANVEKIRAAKVGEILRRGGAKIGDESIARALTDAHAAYRDERKAWRGRAKREREARSKARIAFLRGEA
jgi:hypothetical protein